MINSGGNEGRGTTKGDEGGAGGLAALRRRGISIVTMGGGEKTRDSFETEQHTNHAQFWWIANPMHTNGLGVKDGQFITELSPVSHRGCEIKRSGESMANFQLRLLDKHGC